MWALNFNTKHWQQEALNECKRAYNHVEGTGKIATYPTSDWHLISHYNITSELHMRVTRINEMITSHK